MINKIVLNGVATFREKAVFETDKQVNLLYGLNGVGKSTFSEFLYDPTAPRFDNCSVEGLDENDTVLVYTQKFVQEYFYECKKYDMVTIDSNGTVKPTEKCLRYLEQNRLDDLKIRKLKCLQGLSLRQNRLNIRLTASIMDLNMIDGSWVMNRGLARRSR